MNRPQTIQIFLPDGQPTSIREAEITNRLVKAILFPRNKMQEVSKREGEDCFSRIQAHNRNKDFWTHCVIISTKTDEYTKTDGKYLEHYCLNKASEVGRYVIDNETGSKKPSISESREYDLLDNFDTAKILLATLGYPIFEDKRKAKNTKELFYCQGKNADAVGELTDDGFLVYKEGTSNIEETKGMNKWIGILRKRLLVEGILKKEKDVYVFQQDYIFNSPSAAAATILARSANGWTSWKDKNGATLDALKRK
jgi:hypothetical protein